MDFTPPEHTPPTRAKWKITLAWVALIFGALLLLGGILNGHTIFAIFLSLVFIAPAVWFLFAPQSWDWKRGTAVAVAAFIVSMFFVPKNSQDDKTEIDHKDSTTTTSTTSTSPSASKTTTSSSKPSTPATSTSRTSSTDAAKPADDNEPNPVRSSSAPASTTAHSTRTYAPAPTTSSYVAPPQTSSYVAPPQTATPEYTPPPVVEEPIYEEEPTYIPEPDPVQPAPEPAPISGSGLKCADVGRVTHRDSGDPLYDPRQDSDGDGIGCESYA